MSNFGSLAWNFKYFSDVSSINFDNLDIFQFFLVSRLRIARIAYAFHNDIPLILIQADFFLVSKHVLCTRVADIDKIYLNVPAAVYSERINIISAGSKTNNKEKEKIQFIPLDCVMTYWNDFLNIIWYFRVNLIGIILIFVMYGGVKSCNVITLFLSHARGYVWEWRVI